MIVTIHQPEYLPWIGFFDRIQKSDIFVLLDTVQYQKAGFINRNKIKTAEGQQWITVPIKGGSRIKNINEIEVSNTPGWQKKHWNKIKNSYLNAPYFEKYSPIFQEILLDKEWGLLSDLDCRLIETIMNILGIKTKIIKASSLNIESAATELNIDICRRVGGDIYLSGQGGKNYMDMKRFKEENIKVLFQEFVHPSYQQRFIDSGFTPYMSVIDLLFNCGPKSLEIIQSGSKI